jgi:hypothetical protein
MEIGFGRTTLSHGATISSAKSCVLCMVQKKEEAFFTTLSTLHPKVLDSKTEFGVSLSQGFPAS